MRVVDDHRERLPLLDRLEAPGHAADRLDAPLDRFVVDAECARRERRTRGVQPVEGAAELQVDAVEHARAGVEGDRVRQLGGEAAPVLVADVHDRGVRLLEERPLRLVVALHRAVVVEMVLRQVREDEHGEVRAREPSLDLRDRRRLHHTAVVTPVDHLAEEALEVDRLRRVETGRPLPSGHEPLDVRQQPRPASRGLEDRVQQECRRRLAVRAGHARDIELVRRLAEEERRRRRHRGA